MLGWMRQVGNIMQWQMQLQSHHSLFHWMAVVQMRWWLLCGHYPLQSVRQQSVPVWRLICLSRGYHKALLCLASCIPHCRCTTSVTHRCVACRQAPRFKWRAIKIWGLSDSFWPSPYISNARPYISNARHFNRKACLLACHCERPEQTGIWCTFAPEGAEVLQQKETVDNCNW